MVICFVVRELYPENYYPEYRGRAKGEYRNEKCGEIFLRAFNLHRVSLIKIFRDIIKIFPAIFKRGGTLKLKTQDKS